MSWRDDKSRAEPFMPEVKQHLGSVLLREGTLEEDATQNTDLITLRMEAIRIAVRIRDVFYRKRYGHQFTIRSHRDSGAKTELQKIRDGWAELFFYGFADLHFDLAVPPLAQWCILDLHVFRTNEHNAKVARGDNGDGTYFNAYDIFSFPPGLVKRSHGLTPVQKEMSFGGQESNWPD